MLGQVHRDDRLRVRLLAARQNRDEARAQLATLPDAPEGGWQADRKSSDPERRDTAVAWGDVPHAGHGAADAVFDKSTEIDALTDAERAARSGRNARPAASARCAARGTAISASSAPRSASTSTQTLALGVTLSTASIT